MRCSRLMLLITVLLALTARLTHAQEPPDRAHKQRLILAHYMPWYVAKPTSQVWGWHWTMNHFDPEQVIDGKRQIASHYYPLIGPYDSGDKDILEYHLLTMKLAGIDGVIVDWYGLTDLHDYAILHKNTQRLVEQATRLDMNFVICYEDHTISALFKANRLTANERVEHAVREINWLAKDWFQRDNYVRLDDQPVLLSFGHAGLTNDEWKACLEQLPSPVTYFSEHFRREGAAGAFDWPIPKQGLAATERFAETARDWPHSIPVAFPRFIDIYAEAKLHAGYGRIEDDDGNTFRTSIERALASNSQIIQVATWNDWGEGTNIEPSLEFEYRDLEVLQELRRRRIANKFTATANDLRLPRRLLQLRREVTSAEDAKQLDEIAHLLSAGRVAEARSALEQTEQLP